MNGNLRSYIFFFDPKISTKSAFMNEFMKNHSNHGNDAHALEMQRFIHFVIHSDRGDSSPCYLSIHSVTRVMLLKL